ncbi:hypothetical protein J2Z35_001196 [Acetoanaerobium pronyense]|uniref:Uncharacterized protein n=1 Tax=Acetoanaerobium pronyense TaxID=1482736 RepID=A0ABS4KHZ4_9FIRM|nr:hypothetical protein [Acetoanaerobium pronyense]MBP2027402.1 hypothetical protein [Acetoanaerobium pronyense]
MIKYTDILKAINAKIKEAFPDKEIQSKDITEGFERPSFFIDFSNMAASEMMNYFRNRVTTIVIYYFPSDRYKNRIEILGIQDKLEEIFLDMLKVNEDFIITINETEANIVDGILQFSFDLETVEQIERESPEPLIEELDIEIRKEG